MTNPIPVSPAWKRWISVEAYGAFTSMLFGAHTEPAVLRARFERFARTSRAHLRSKHPGLRFGDHAFGSLEIESVQATAAPSAVVLHLHGGAFFFGSPASYRARAMRLGYRFDAEVFVPDYRLAPEHPFPAALDDALIAYQYVRSLRPRAPIVVTGDSAGGGLALSLLVRLRELGEPMPAGGVLLSPWTDLSVSGPCRDARDRWLKRAHLESWARYYAGRTEPATPLLSPVFADLRGLPPLLVLVGEHEVLLDDATRVVESAQLSGTDAELLVGARMQHDWPLTLPWLEESRAAWTAMRGFVDHVCGR
jgi:epsilon-lactone hydrolase